MFFGAPRWAQKALGKAKSAIKETAGGPKSRPRGPKKDPKERQKVPQISPQLKERAFYGNARVNRVFEEKKISSNKEVGRKNDTEMKKRSTLFELIRRFFGAHRRRST